MSTELLRKLGVRDGSVARSDTKPSSVALDLPPLAAGEEPDVLVAFVSDAAAVRTSAARVLPSYRDGGALWFAYPKKSGSIATDISRDTGWDVVAEAGFLPVTQVAIDADWSALRFRRRHEIGKLTRKHDLPGKRT